MASGACVATLEELTAGARKKNGKVSATDVIMVVKKCNRNNASKILRLLREEERIPELEMVCFGESIGESETDSPHRGRGDNRRPEAAADARQNCAGALGASW